MLAQSTTLYTLFDFSSENGSGQWLPVNDSVMGGISDSSMEILSDSIGHFSGTVSLENNGGFASVRTLVQNSYFKGLKGIKIRVLGDGNTYSLRLRTNMQFDGVSFRSSFETKNEEWIEIEFPFSEFIPTFRGRTLRNVGKIAPETISQIGILISDKQTGSFSLKIDWIAIYK